MEVDTDRQSADAHLDDDPLMQAALADDSISTDRDTKPENQPGPGPQYEAVDQEQGNEGKSAGQPAPASQQPPPAPQQEQSPQFIGILKELLDERKTRQEIQRDRDELRRWREEQERNKAAPDFYTQPAEAARHEYQSLFQSQVAPVLQQMQNARLFDARQIAYQIHGKDKADAAIKAFDETASPAERQEIMNSLNPFISAVELQTRKQVLSEVGTDPSKYRDKVLEEALKNPDFLAKAMHAAQAAAAANPTTRAPPSNVTRLPSVARVGSAANIIDAGPADESDAELLQRIERSR
jgi:hypothetical protein